MPKKAHKNTQIGTISLSSRGTGYVSLEGKKKDIEIDFKNLGTALHSDTVEVVGNKVVKIVKRAKTKFAGVLQKEKGQALLIADDTRMYADILISEKDLHGAKPGQKIFVEISWHDPKKLPEGKVLKILGKPGDNDAEMHAIAIEKGFDAELPAKIEQEAQKIKARGLREEDYKGRKDMRSTLTFTIDPADAKDFDDAISFKELKGGEYEVGVHIADVSHYVRPGTAIDGEARERGTSVYLVDRTIPMLPEVLSNDLCSLVPNKDRLTMSAIFVLDKNANVKSEWFGKTVIHSSKRFTYEEAEVSITDPRAPLHKELSILNGMAKKLTEERFRKGAVSLDADEVKFVLDAQGKPIKVIKKQRGDSNRLIEEFMLLANRKVAELISKDKSNVFVYRVHDLPNPEKTADLIYFLRSLGHEVRPVNGVIPSRQINAMLESLEGKNERDTVHRAVIRSMAKAIYSTKNIGHYGLAFDYYTHFTSPIRRYPDILVHRFLEEYLAGKKIPKEKMHEFEEASRTASEQEKRAADAERASIKYKQVEYMSVRLGKVFDGVVSGVTEWGIYVEEVETKCEGMIRLRDMTDDYYVFNEKKLELVGEKKKKRYRLGDRVKIKVRAVDLEKKTIDYILV